MSQQNVSADIIPFILTLVDQSRDVFWIKTPDYKGQLYISPSYERVWGRSCESLYNNPDQWAETLHPDDLKRLLASVKERGPRVEAGKFFSETYRIIRPNGELCWIKDKSLPIFNKNGEHIGFAGIAQDITEDKKREEEVLKAKEIAEAASLAKSEFIRNMSHDMRTPLTGIIGMAEIINREPLAQITQEGARDIHQAGLALLNLLNEIIETAQLESGETPVKNNCFKLKETIDALAAIFRPAIKHKHLRLETYYDDNIPNVLFGQELLLHRIILNLLGNAVKFTEQGEISLEVSLLLKRADKVSLKIVVKDTGLGIPTDKQNIIFDKFSRLTPSYEGHYKGSGLGLYMVKQYIEKLGGEIHVNSSPGRGAQFTCTVQFKLPTKAQLNKFLPKIVSPSKKNVQILLVEDSPIAQKATQFNLQAWTGGVVDVASNGKDALAKTLLKKYDGIYLDLGLPDLDGKLVAQRIRQNAQSLNQHTPIMALTVYTDPAILQECLAVGINKVISKPLSKNELQIIAQRVVDWALWRERCGGHEDLVRQAFEITMRMLQEFKTQSITAINTKDYEALDNVVHKCYGGLKYCSLPALEEVTFALQQAIRDRQYHEVSLLHQKFIEQINSVLELSYSPL